MTNNKMIILLILLFCLACLVQSVRGSEQPDSNTTFLLGPGIVVTDKPYAGMDTTVYPIPLMRFICGQFYISGATAGFRFLADETYTFDIVGKWRFDGYEDDDSRDLKGMHDRRQTIDLGGELTLLGDWGSLTMGFLTDSLSRHDGQEMRISYAKPFDIEKLTISPYVGLDWQSSNLADYYYGVRADEVRAGRPAYNVSDAVNWFAGIYTSYNLDNKWTLIGGISYYWLDSEIYDSPIVNDSHAISVLAGAMYQF
jgi:outer membrane protein